MILRKIRGTAISGLGKPRSWVSSLFQRKLPIPEDRHKVLEDGEKLATSAASFLALRIITGTRSSVIMDCWESQLQDATKKYDIYQPVTFAKTTTLDVAGSTLAHMRAMSVDPEYVLDWDLFKANRIGPNNLQDLLARKVTIVAPLSGDLLLAAIHRSQVEITRGIGFPLKTAALSKDLSQIVLPNLSVITGEVGIFLDVIDTGRTGTTLARKLREDYPDLVVNEPRHKRIEFQPSKKIRKARGK